MNCLPAIIGLSVGLLTCTLCSTYVYFMFGLLCGMKIMMRMVASENRKMSRNMDYVDMEPMTASALEVRQNDAYN